MQLYADENFSQSVVQHLRDLGYDVLTTVEAGKSQQAIADPEVLQFATVSNRVLITFNKWDFVKLHDLSPDHAGIVVCTQDRDSSALAQRIHNALNANPDMQGKLVRVNRPSSTERS